MSRQSNGGAEDGAEDPKSTPDAEPEFDVLIPPLIQTQYEFGDYAEAYRQAAVRIADAAEASPDLGSHLTLPALFLYRHALELALKDANVWTEVTLASASANQHGRSVDEVRKDLQGHKLRPLFTRLQERFSLVDSQFGATELGGLPEAVGPAVFALDGLDVDGQRLRYPFLSRGAGPSWSSDRRGPTVSDIQAVRREVEIALHHLLDLMGSWFSTVMDRAIEQAWLDQLWVAEERALRLEGIWGWPPDHSPRDPSASAWSSAIVEELKSDMSAELLDDGDDP